MHRNHLEILRKTFFFFITCSPFSVCTFAVVRLAIFFLICQIFQNFSLHRSMVRYNIVVLYPQPRNLGSQTPIKSNTLTSSIFHSFLLRKIQIVRLFTIFLQCYTIARSIDPCNESTSYSYFFFPPIVLAAIWGEDRLICGNVLRSKDFCSRQLAYQLRNSIENYRWRRHRAARLDVFEIRRPVISSTLES